MDKLEHQTLTCDIVQDLIPLAADGVASDDSEQAVLRHIEHCADCRDIYRAMAHRSEQPVQAPDDKKILSYLRRQYAVFAAMLMMFGAMMGVMLTDTVFIFQNILIMPMVGALAYCCLRKKGWWLAPAVVVFTIVRSTAMQEMDRDVGIIYGLIYGGLIVVGIVIAALLRYAFRKDDKEDHGGLHG